MKDLFVKELKLCASALTYFFLAFGLMFFLPGYPILCGAFFTTLGIFQSFRNAVDTNDILFSALLPVSKQDVVKVKYLFACFIELCGIIIMAAAAIIRMTVLKDAVPYRMNALMGANFFSLGMALVIFGVFNAIFIGGFFKTSYKITRPFILYSVTAFVIIGIGEALWHFPGLASLNAFGFEHITLQLALFAACLIIYAILTLLSLKDACRNFEKTDL